MAGKEKELHKSACLEGALGYIPKSKYILGILPGLNFSNKKHRGYIRDLSSLERFILEGRCSWAGGMAYSSLKNQYPSAYKAIYSELKPVEYKKLLKEGEYERKESEEFNKRYEAERRQGLADYKSWWLSAGGKK